MDYIPLIETAFHSKNSDQRKEGERQLFLIATNDQNAINNLLQLTKYKLEITQFIVSLIKRRLQNQDQYPIEQRILDAESIRLALGSKLEILHKDTLVIALQNLLTQDKENQLKQIFINQVKQLFATKQAEQIEQGLYMTQAIMVEELVDFEFFNQIFQIGQCEQFKQLWQKTIIEILNNIMKPKSNFDATQNVILSSPALAQALQVQFDYFKKQTFDHQEDILLLRIVSKLFNKLIKHKPIEFINQCALFQYYLFITQICINTLLKDFQNTNFDINIILNTQIKESVYLMLKFINLGCRQLRFFEFYQNSKVQLILDVIFPLCMATSKDIQDIEFDPEEYIKCQQDIIKYQSSSIPQTASAELLKSFLYLDGTTTFVFDFAITILQKAIDESYHNEILKLINDKYIMKISQLQKIHMSIQVLCIISGFACERYDLIIRLSQFIDKNQAIISNNTNSVIVKLKFTQLIGSYCQQICKLSKDNFHKYLQYLLEFLSVQNQNVLLYQGVETFKIIIDSDENRKFIQPILYDLTIKLCSNLQDCQYAEVFELILEIITKYKQSITEELLQFILQSVVSKILYEHQMINQNERNEIWLNLSFNILKMLPDQDFIPKYTDLIESSMTQIINLLQSILFDQIQKANGSIEFAEDIFVLFSGIIDQTKRITDTELRVFILSFNVLESQFWRLGQLFELYNLIIVYGPHIFNDVTFQLQFLQILSKLALEQNDKINEADNSESLLIFQLLLEKVQITIEGVQIIYNTLIKRSEIKIVNNFFRSRLYCTFLQLARYVQQYQIFNVLQNFQEILFKVIKELPQCLSKGYDTKLYIISLSEMVQQNHQLWNEVVINMIEKLNDQLEYEGVEETKDEDMFDINEIEAEANIILGVFLGKVLKEDEFTYFYNLYCTMQKSSPIIIDNRHLKKILMTQRINGKPRQVFRKKLKKQ